MTGDNDHLPDHVQAYRDRENKIVLEFRFETYSFSQDGAEELAEMLMQATDRSEK